MSAIPQMNKPKYTVKMLYFTSDEVNFIDLGKPLNSNVMKKTILIFILLFGFNGLQAQEYFLPVSTDSEAAKQYYHDALFSAHHADISSYNQSIKKAVNEDPEFFMAHAHFALGMAGMDQPDLFNEHASKALSISESRLNPAEKSMPKALLILKKDPKGDLSAVMNELEASYPEVPQVYDIGLFVNYWISKDYKAAVENGKKLVKLSPKHGGGYNMLGYAHMEAGDMKSAKSAFKKYIKHARNEANAYDSMGEYYMNVKDYKNSAKYYQKATDMGMEDSRERAEEAKRMMAN